MYTNDGFFGTAVNMNGDGDFIYIASYVDTNYTGATFVYRKNTATGKYYEYQPKLVGTPHLPRFSYQNLYGISVTSSGSLIAISSQSGAYWIFALNGTFPPSQSPTTSHPSQSPTRHPSDSPSRSPTIFNTTSHPSHSPTRHPSDSPSRSPTVLNGSSVNSQEESLIIGVAVGVSFGVMLLSIALGLLIFLRRKRKSEQVNLDSTSLLVASNRNFKASLVPATLKSEDPEQPSEKIPVADIVDTPADSNASNFLFFFSYARVDTSAETAVLYDKAKIMFPNEHVFRDSEHFFKLDELIIRVKRAKNCLVLLSYHYPRRPFTLVELHVALENGLHIIPVKVLREGMKPFDHHQVAQDITHGRVYKYLSKNDWQLLKTFGMNEEAVCKDLQTLLNIKAFDLSLNFASTVREAMIEDILRKGLVV